MPIDSELSILVGAQVEIVKGLQKYICVSCNKPYVAPQNTNTNAWLDWFLFHKDKHCYERREKK